MRHYIFSKVKFMFSKTSLTILLISIFYIFSLQHVYSASTQELEDTLKKYKISYQQQYYIWNDFSIDLSPLDDLLQENFSDTPLEYEWDIYGQSPQKWAVFNTQFTTPGKKSIQLSIYSQDDEVKKLIYKSDISVFIYEKSIPLIVSSWISEKMIEDFKLSGEDLGVYIKILWNFDEDNISGNDIIERLNEYKISYPESSDYFMIWWEKEFLFSSLSQIHTKWKEANKLNFVLISAYNTSILKNYISNSIRGKGFIDKAFIIDDSLRLQVLKSPQSIEKLEKELEKNSYSYTPISGWETIAPYFFASRFVNMLSNMGISNSDIYIILLLPLFLSVVGFSKHMIGLSSLWSVIPVFMTLLFIKMGILFTLSFIWFLLIFNIIISWFISKYTLLYTPKVACITILNLLAFMIFYQYSQYFTFIHIPLDNVLYVVIFLMLAEKMITIITSKEFREYKKSIWGSVIISILCYMMYNFDSLRVFLMAYPETLLIFVPLNFFLGRFTWLRVTEYLRFKEIVKNIEE